MRARHTVVVICSQLFHVIGVTFSEFNATNVEHLWTSRRTVLMMDESLSLNGNDSNIDLDTVLCMRNYSYE